MKEWMARKTNKFPVEDHFMQHSGTNPTLTLKLNERLHMKLMLNENSETFPASSHGYHRYSFSAVMILASRSKSYVLIIMKTRPISLTS